MPPKIANVCNARVNPLVVAVYSCRCKVDATRALFGYNIAT